jgi:predicted RNase H-like HicB family nuclease
MAEEPSRWNATIPTVPGCLSWGPTLDEARANVREALAACLVAEHGLDALAIADDAELVETDKETFDAAFEYVKAAVDRVIESAEDHAPQIRELAARLVAEEETDEDVVYEFFDGDAARQIADLLAEDD